MFWHISDHFRPKNKNRIFWDFGDFWRVALFGGDFSPWRSENGDFSYQLQWKIILSAFRISVEIWNSTTGRPSKMGTKLVTFWNQKYLNFVPNFEGLPVVEFQISTDFLKAETIIFQQYRHEKSSISLLQGKKSPSKRATRQKSPKSQKIRFLFLDLKWPEICWNVLSW